MYNCIYCKYVNVIGRLGSGYLCCMQLINYSFFFHTLIYGCIGPDIKLPKPVTSISEYDSFLSLVSDNDVFISITLKFVLQHGSVNSSSLSSMLADCSKC